MALKRQENYVQLYPGEWVAISSGHVIAHGLDFREVAQEAYLKALDISFDHVPDPQAPIWQAEAPVEPPRSSFIPPQKAPRPKRRSLFARFHKSRIAKHEATPEHHPPLDTQA